MRENQDGLWRGSVNADERVNEKIEAGVVQTTIIIASYIPAAPAE
jgi:hypothetical protein